MDIVYPVRAGDSNEELRWSLRCVHTNFPHDRVWIVGHKPNWVTNVEFIPGNGSWRHANVYNNILAAAEHPDTADEFLVMNDDFFITEPLTRVPVFYRGSLSAQVDNVKRYPRNWWFRSLKQTEDRLRMSAIRDPLSYELHVPLPVVKAGMAAVLRQFHDPKADNPPQWRSLYGNLCGIGGQPRGDCKAYSRSAPVGVPFHSSTDQSWLGVAAGFKASYPDPSPYEK